jgi:hypothetical protein
MITTIASSYGAAASAGPAEPHSAWRRAWQQLRTDQEAGRRIPIIELASYLADVPVEDQQDCVCDLVAEHLRLYSRAGEPNLDDYVAALGGKFASLREVKSLPAELIEDEFLTRSTPPHGDYPRLTNYGSRFPDRPDVHERLARRCLAGGRYVKLRVLGAGAMGIVHEAYDSVADRLVAVKESSLADPSAAERLAREVQHLRCLDHPGIVAIYDAGEAEDRVYCVMELVAGPSLASLIAEYHRGRADRSKAENQRQLHRLIEHVAQAADAMAHAHARGLLHRDLKPGNVLIRESGEAAIVDWGLARSFLPVRPVEDPDEGERDTEGIDFDTTIAGTPQYMAPEQADRQETAASDIFSLGATLYEALTGRPPFDWRPGFLPSNWPEAVRQSRIQPPRRLTSRLPRQLDAICLRALARNPGDRHITASDLATDVRRFLAGDGQATGWLKRLAACLS